MSRTDRPAHPGIPQGRLVRRFGADVKVPVVGVCKRRTPLRPDAKATVLRPATVVVDAAMCSQCGPDPCDRLRSHAAVPMLAVVGGASHADVVRVLAAGATSASPGWAAGRACARPFVACPRSPAAGTRA